jgi:AcrR family transcriptional regulator
MARKTTFTRDDVVSAALAVVQERGLAALTARSVARRLSASTAPVYSNFASMEQLQQQVLALADAQLRQSCLQMWTAERFLNMGIGYLHYALDHPNLFKALYYERHDEFCPQPAIKDALLGVLDTHPLLGALPRPIKEELLFQASVYSHGLAVLICSGLWRDPDLELATRWLRNVGGLLVQAAMAAAGLSMPPEAIELFADGTVPWRNPRDARGERDHA